MARPRTVSDQTILEMAREVFLEHGPGTSTEVVAKRLGLSQAALFKRFGTKRSLMIAALSPPSAPPFTLRLDSGPSEDPAVQEQLRSLGTDLAQFFSKMVPNLMCLRAAGVLPEDLLARFDTPPPMVAQQALSSWLSRAMAQGRLRKSDPSALAYALLGAFHMKVFVSHLSRRPLSPEELSSYAEDVVDALWGGLNPVEST